jgi:hypothetical protein
MPVRFTGQAFNQITNASIQFTMQMLRAQHAAWSLSCRVEPIDYIISFYSSEIYTTKYRAQRTAGRITDYYMFFLSIIRNRVA